MGGVCSMYRGRGEVYTGFWCGNLKEREHLENLGVDWRIILKWIFEVGGWGGRDWIELAQDRGRWRALLNAVMDLRVA